MISNLDFESENPFQIYSGSSNDFYSLFSDKLSVNLATIQSEGIQDKFFQRSVHTTSLLRTLILVVSYLFCDQNIIHVSQYPWPIPCTCLQVKMKDHLINNQTQLPRFCICNFYVEVRKAAWQHCNKEITDTAWIDNSKEISHYFSQPFHHSRYVNWHSSQSSLCHSNLIKNLHIILAKS